MLEVLLQNQQLIIEYGGITCSNSLEDTIIKNCYYLTGTCEGGINGENIDGKAMKKTEEEMKTDDFVELLNENKESEDVIWKKDTQNKNYGYPILFFK